MAGSIASIALRGTKSVMRFIGGAWSKDVGTAFRTAHLDPNIKASVFNFNWKKAYCDYFAKSAQASTKVVSETVSKGGFWNGVKNCLGKIPGMKFIGRNLGPIVMFGPMLITAYSEMKEGGIVSGVKELLKGGIGWAGWSIGTCAAAALGFTGMWIPLVFGIGVSMITGWGANKVLGPSCAEQKAELAKQQQQMQEQYGINPQQKTVDMQEIDRKMEQIIRLYNERNNPLGATSTPRSINPAHRTFVA